MRQSKYELEDLVYINLGDKVTYIGLIKDIHHVFQRNSYSYYIYIVSTIGTNNYMTVNEHSIEFKFVKEK